MNKSSSKRASRHAAPQNDAERIETERTETKRSKTKRTDTKRSRLTKRILVAVAVSLVLVYIVFLFITTNFLGSNNIVTETAYSTKAYDIIESKCVIARDEHYLTGSAGGVLVYNVNDGDKVTSDGVVATAYASQDDASTVQRAEELDAKINYLESITAANTSTNVGVDTINSQINERLIKVLKSVNDMDYTNMSGVEEDLLTSILRKQLLTGEQGDIDERISELKSERASIGTVSASGSVEAGAAGYFVSKVDGYEQTFDVSKLDEITASQVENAQPADIDPDSYIGKIIKGTNWYLLCPVTADQATALSHADETIKIRLPSAVTGDIPAKILHINNSGGDQALAVLQCNYMSDALSKLRQENVEIIVNEYDGLKISKSALHDDDITYTVVDDDGNKTEKTERVQGVYVEYGVELVFKQVAILYAADEYVICNENPEDGVLLDGTTVSLYDKVVVEGGDLFNGKLIG